MHAFRTAANQPINLNTDDLGTLGGTSSFAYRVNSSGQVAGLAYNSAGVDRAFLYSGNGPMQDLGTFGGPKSGANGINNSGQVVGYASVNPTNFHAFLYSGGTMRDLGTLEEHSVTPLPSTIAAKSWGRRTPTVPPTPLYSAATGP